MSIDVHWKWPGLPCQCQPLPAPCCTRARMVMPRCANSSTFCVHVSVLSSEARVFGTARGWWFSILKKNQLFCYITSDTHKALAFTKPGCNSPSSSISSTASQVHKKQLGDFSYWFLLIYFLKSWDLSFWNSMTPLSCRNPSDVDSNIFSPVVTTFGTVAHSWARTVESPETNTPGFDPGFGVHFILGPWASM